MGIGHAGNNFLVVLFEYNTTRKLTTPTYRSSAVICCSGAKGGETQVWYFRKHETAAWLTMLPGSVPVAGVRSRPEYNLNNGILFLCRQAAAPAILYGGEDAQKRRG